MPLFLVRLAFAVAILLLASAVFLGAAVFLCFAAFLFLAHVMPAPFAALVTALILLFFAIVMLVIARALLSSGGLAPRKGAPPGELLEALLGAEIAGYASKSPFATTGIAFLIGLVFGFSPRLRQVVAELLRGR